VPGFKNHQSGRADQRESFRASIEKAIPVYWTKKLFEPILLADLKFERCATDLRVIIE
jgi:hypothetical protein